jgi:hypothetical protein
MRTRGHDEVSTSQGRDTPIPPPMPQTLVDAIITLVNAIIENTRFLQEMMVNQNNQPEGRGQNNQHQRYHLHGVF